MSASFLEAASERRASLRSSTSELELSDSTDYEEDETAWRAGDDDGDEGEALDDRVAGAFDKLNVAIAQNNRVEAAQTEAIRALEAQKAAGEQSPTMKSLEKKHQKQIRKIERFQADQAAASKAAERLRQLPSEIASAEEVLACANEALELQKESGAKRAADAGFKEAYTNLKEVEAVLEARCTEAANTVSVLTAERKMLTEDLERTTQRILQRAGSLADATEEALPYLTKKSSYENKVVRAERQVRERGEETAKAKAEVKEAMGNLESISRDIQQRQQQREDDSSWA